ncbi:MAG: universal stress protein [bacterium]
MAYKHILVGLDLSDESNQIVKRVQSLMEGRDAVVSLIHVIEPISFAYAGDVPMDWSGLQTKIEGQAAKRLSEAASLLDVDAAHQHIIFGQPAHEIHRFARENDVDLMVVGTHGRHGLSLIFGSTANGVLHGAPCDVFAVKISDQDE